MTRLEGRITGTEMEWGLLARASVDDDYEQPDDKMAEKVIKARHEGLYRCISFGMLSNGGRLYVDVGQHVEYATPEDTSFMGTVANEIAGENILYDAAETLRNDGVFRNVLLSKRVVDDELKTWGYHMSFCADAEKLRIDVNGLRPLGAHLATLNVLTGAGAVIPTRSGAEFVVSQKTLNLNCDFSQSSHQNYQPLISLRSEALADPELFSRVHISSMDANMSPWATWIKLGTTSIIIRMMEEGFLRPIELEGQMFETALQVAHDPNLESKTTLEGGKTIRPIDIQMRLLAQAKRFAKTEYVSDEERAVLREWERALGDMTHDPELLIDRVEWVARRAALRRFMGKHGLSLTNDIVLEKDRQWSYIGPLGIGSKLREGLWKKWMPNERIKDAYLVPPASTRAFVRGAMIRQYYEQGRTDVQANWEYVGVTGQKTKIMPNPYEQRTYDAAELEAPDIDDYPMLEC